MSYHFLILDPTTTVRARLKRAIRAAGLPTGTIHDAVTGGEAIEILAHHHVDLIVADPDLPAGDGAEVIGRILSEPDTRGVPVVLASATPDRPDVQRLRRAGAKGCLRKPITADALRAMLAHVLEPTHV